jgi:hypothetical protein
MSEVLPPRDCDTVLNHSRTPHFLFFCVAESLGKLKAVVGEACGRRRASDVDDALYALAAGIVGVSSSHEVAGSGGGTVDGKSSGHVTCTFGATNRLVAVKSNTKSDH